LQILLYFVYIRTASCLHHVYDYSFKKPRPISNTRVSPAPPNFEAIGQFSGRQNTAVLIHLGSQSSSPPAEFSPLKKPLVIFPRPDGSEGGPPITLEDTRLGIH
jgi:hypothetical protein